MYIIQEIENCFPTFSAARIFDIDRKLFTNIVYSVNTYFLAIIQIDRVYSNGTIIY